MFERDLPGENKGGHSRDAQIGKLPDLEIAIWVHARQMGIGTVGAGDRVPHELHAAIGPKGDFLLQADGPGESHRGAGDFFDHLRRGQL